MTRVDRVVASNAVGGRTAGETLFLVQGVLGDPAALRVGVAATEVVDGDQSAAPAATGS